MRILLLLTGGTIGSENEGGVLKAKQDAVPELEKRWRMEHPQAEVCFVTETPYCLLSEDACPAQWDQLTEAVLRHLPQADGVIIAHGSDTLAFTAAALSVSLAGISIPVVVTGANYPLADPRSNGMRNFAASVEWVRRERIPGVFAVYENPDGELTVHLGARVKSAEAMEHRFDSLFGQPFGWFRRDRFVLNPKGDVSIRMLRDAAGGLRFSGSRFCPDVILLHPYPGLCYSRIRTDGLRAVLHEAYHSSTACTKGEGTSLREFAEHCRAKEILVLLGPADLREEYYESSSKLMDAGVLLLGPMTREAALTKLMFGAGRCSDAGELAQWMKTPVGFEQTRR